MKNKNQQHLKTWEIAQAVTDEQVSKFLDEGFEPYAVVFIPGAGTVHYLRIFR